MSCIPLIIGHRGASHLAPENTMAAFGLAWLEGADGIEADFRLTLDKQIVAHHDATTLRTSGVKLPIADTSLDRLTELNACAGWGEVWPAQIIPTLAAILQTLPIGKRFFIELKSGKEIITPLLRLLNEIRPCPEQIRILAFNEDLLLEIKQLQPQYRTCWLTDFRQIASRYARNTIIEKTLKTLESCGSDGLGGKAGRMIDAELVGVLRKMGKEIHVWTVNSGSAGRRFASLGVDSIITNRPGWLRMQLGHES